MLHARSVHSNPSIMEDHQRASIEKLVEKICTEENITNPNVKYVTDVPKNGYLSTLAKIEITGNGKELYLIAKYAGTDEAFRKNLQVRVLYLREIKIYTEVMPLYKKLQENYGAKNPFTSTPRCYGFDDTPKCELLILEDLIRAGYVLKNSLITMDAPHVELVLKEYGKFHAVALAYKHHDFEGYQKLIQNTDNVYRHFVENDAMGVFHQALFNFRDNLDPDEPMSKAFSKICDNVREIQDKNVEIDEYTVLYHGDSWCNNFMFKYENDSNQPTAVKFIDFQITGPGPLILDVSYFFMANSSPEMIANTEHFLKVYYDGLANHLKDLNCDPEVVFSYSTFKDQWRKHGVHGLMAGITALKFAMAEPDEKPDLTNNYDNAVNYVGKHDAEYRRRTEAILLYYYEAGIISD